MKSKLIAVVVAGLGLLLCTVPMLAHHSFAAEYDSAKPVTLTGTVTNVEWMNPHARFYIDVKDDKGEMANWELELGSPNGHFAFVVLHVDIETSVRIHPLHVGHC